MGSAGTIEVWHVASQGSPALLVAVASFVAGALLMAYLAADASRLFFQTLRVGYGGKEEIAAVCIGRKS